MLAGLLAVLLAGFVLDFGFVAVVLAFLVVPAAVVAFLPEAPAAFFVEEDFFAAVFAFVALVVPVTAFVKIHC